MSTHPTDTDSTPSESDSASTSTGLDENVAGALAYLLGFVTGVVFYLVENENAFVRFHAAQSIVVFGLVLALSIGLSIVGVVVSTVLVSGSAGGFLAGGIISLVLGLLWLVVWGGSFVLWVYLMLRAYQGKTPRIPVAATIADGLV